MYIMCITDAIATAVAAPRDDNWAAATSCDPGPAGVPGTISTPASRPWVEWDCAASSRDRAPAKVLETMTTRSPQVIGFFGHDRGLRYARFSNFWQLRKPYEFTLPSFALQHGFPPKLRCSCSEKAIMLTKPAMMRDRATFDDMLRTDNPARPCHVRRSWDDCGGGDYSIQVAASKPPPRCGSSWNSARSCDQIHIGAGLPGTVFASDTSTARTEPD